MKMTSDDVPPVSSADVAFETLKHQLLIGAYPAGQRLRERSLAESLGVSRTPLREALRRLEQERMVTRAANGSLYVTSLDERGVNDVYQLRAQIEALAVELAIDRAPDDEVTMLEELLEQCRQSSAAGDMAAVLRLNTEFHDHLYEMSRSPWLQAVVDPLRSQLMRVRVHMTAHRLPETYLREHGEICEALRARDTARAQQAVRVHAVTDLKHTLRNLDSVLAAGRGATH